MQKSKFTDENYVCPSKAAKKLMEAKRYHTPLYLYGVTGIGKTSLVRNNLNQNQCSYYSAQDTMPEQVCDSHWEEVMAEANERKSQKGIIYTVILDDLHSVVEDELRDAWRERIRELLDREDVWLILIARCPFPRWLLTLRTRYLFAEIPEEDFLFDMEEQKQYLDKCGLHLSMEQQKIAWKVGCGNPLSLLFFVMEHGNLELTKKRFWDYLESHVYDQWELPLQEFFMAVSIVERFTVKLASMLTGRSDVEQLIAEAEVQGNFFTVRGIDGVWECRWEMRQSMLQKLHRKETEEQINRLYYKAGLYYELENQIPQALEMYEQYHDMESISRLLVSNARKDPSSGHYYELRRYYLELPEKIIENSPILMAGMSLLQSMLLNVEESERWYGKLEEYAKKQNGSLRKEARSRLLFLKISLGHRGNVDMIDILKSADVLLRDKKAVLPELSVTSNLPSMLNGGKDFCEWTKQDTEFAGSIGRILSFVLGKYGKGLVPLALAENYLEKGGDTFQIFSLAEKGKMEAGSGGKLEQVFVGTGILAWLSILNKDADGAEAALQSFRQRAVREAPRLVDNIDAFLCRIHLYQGKDVTEWMQTAPDERKEFCIMERFRYLTKVRVYLSMGQYEAAYCLLQQLAYYAEIMKRTYIRMEIDLLSAVVQYHRQQAQWQETLQSCISRAEEYHFVRLITREGALIYPLLKKGKLVWKEEAFRKQVLTECQKMEKAYPSYPGRMFEEIVLSDNAVRILQLQSEGMSAASIAARLKLSEATIKYHSKETYRKLGVNNKTAALAEARKRGLI